jgi:catechol 2,3-dioxygenase-like lactoylglutathione lyase family enzyme
MAEFPAPAEGIVLTHFIVASDADRTRRCYADVLGGELLRRLGDRMPDTKSDWIEDRELSLSTHGGYDPPLTDRQSMIEAAQAVVDSLATKLNACRQQQRAPRTRLAGHRSCSRRRRTPWS